MNVGAAADFAIEWKDYGPFVQGTGAVIAAIGAAVIAGYFLTRNSKKTPYEQLEILVKAREAWPDGLAGVETVERSIGNALARIRDIEIGVHDASETHAERKADRYAALQGRREIFRANFIGAMLGVFIAAAAWFSTGDTYKFGPLLFLGIAASAYWKLMEHRTIGKLNRIWAVGDDDETFSRYDSVPELFDY